MSNDTKISQLSVLINSVVRIAQSNSKTKHDDCNKALKILENTLSPFKLPSRPTTVNPNLNESIDQQRVNLSLIEESHEQSPSANTKQIFKQPSPNVKQESKIIMKKRMKWRDYLQKQVEKQRKIQELSGTIPKSPDKPTRKPIRIPVSFREKIDIKALNKEKSAFKPVEIKDNFKKLDEQECFVEDDEKNEEQINSPESERENAVNEEKETPLILADPEKRIAEIIDRYEKTIGKLKTKEPSIAGSRLSQASPQPEFRPKSSYSRVSTESQKQAVQKLRLLREEEEKIKQQKEELIKFLESRSQARQSSRMETVSSIMSKQKEERGFSPVGYKQIEPVKSALPSLSPMRKEKQKISHMRHGSAQTENRRVSNNEVKDLLSNLF
jgi:hypothetical protein